MTDLPKGWISIPWIAAETSYQHIRKFGPPPEIVAIKAAIEDRTERAERFYCHYGWIDQASVDEITRLRLKLDQAYGEFAMRFAR
jgi:hypothetical protein